MAIAGQVLLVWMLAAGWCLGGGVEEEPSVDPREGCSRWMGGVPGTPGLDGQPGRDGREGRRGETGETGDQGPRGEQGERGDPGGEGGQGLRGFPGTPGLKGNRGESSFPYRSAFSVGLTSPTSAVDTPILFTKTFYNEQHHYDDISGKFRCFIPGVYYFTFHLTVQGVGLRVGLYKNGRVVSLTLDQYLTSDLDQTSGSSVLTLAAGDQVWMEVYGPEMENGAVFADITNDSTFTGFLVQPRLPVSPMANHWR